MNENSKCPIWGTPTKPTDFYRGDGLNIDSPRTGGKYFVDGRSEIRVRDLDDREKARLSTWLIEQRRSGVERPEIWSYEHYIESIVYGPDLSVHARADGLLKYIQRNTPGIGTEFVFRANDPNDAQLEMEIFAYTESINRKEWKFLFDYLVGQGWLQNRSKIGKLAGTITVDGYGRLAELENVVTVSSQAFVAMWFNDTLGYLYPEAIEPAIKDAGYDALIINQEHFLDKIDDQIIAEIKRSRFVVADFTHGNDGARGSVYYEAGFAQGLGKDVIFTCRKDMIDNNEIHFDIRQYPYVVWEKNDLGKFKESLTFRIARVIGDGPRRVGE